MNKVCACLAWIGVGAAGVEFDIGWTYEGIGVTMIVAEILGLLGKSNI